MSKDEVLALITATENPLDAQIWGCRRRIVVQYRNHFVVFEKVPTTAYVFAEENGGVAGLQRLDGEAFNAIWNHLKAPCRIENDRVAVATIFGLLAAILPEFYYGLNLKAVI